MKIHQIVIRFPRNSICAVCSKRKRARGNYGPNWSVLRVFVIWRILFFRVRTETHECIETAARWRSSYESLEYARKKKKWKFIETVLLLVRCCSLFSGCLRQSDEARTEIALLQCLQRTEENKTINGKWYVYIELCGDVGMLSVSVTVSFLKINKKLDSPCLNSTRTLCAVQILFRRPQFQSPIKLNSNRVAETHSGCGLFVDSVLFHPFDQWQTLKRSFKM